MSKAEKHPRITRENIMLLLNMATRIEIMETPPRTFLKRIVANASEANALCDLFIAGPGDGVVRVPEPGRKHPAWGVSYGPDGGYRGFYPVLWTGDSGDRINCWYRIK